MYGYEGEIPVPVVSIQRTALQMSDALRDAVERFSAAASDAAGSELQRYVFARVLVAIITQAALAHARGVATRSDIDTALRFGTNYPKGPFEWTGRIGHERCVRLLDALNQTVADDRFAVPALFSGATSNHG